MFGGRGHGVFSFWLAVRQAGAAAKVRCKSDGRSEAGGYSALPKDEPQGHPERLFYERLIGLPSH